MEGVDFEGEHASPDPVLCISSEESGRVSVESAASVFSSPSKIASAKHLRPSSFERLKNQMQRALNWGPGSREHDKKFAFNPELLANQKRQWYHIHSHMDRKQHKEPSSLMEQFFIVGLHPNDTFDLMGGSFAQRKFRESDLNKFEVRDLRELQHDEHLIPILEPQILFKYPLKKRSSMHVQNLPAFCFPEGVKARVIQRTPSMSDLNEMIYGQEHLCRDDSSFIFSLKVAENATLYGVCLHVQEIVQHPPSILGAVSPFSQVSVRRSRFLLSAPRCYCILTRLPFFELHFEMLNSIISQARLERIAQFVSETSLNDFIPLAVAMPDQMNGDSDYRASVNSCDWSSSAMPVNSMFGSTEAVAEFVSDNEAKEPQSPESASASDTSDFCQARELDKDAKKNLQLWDGYTSETSESCSDSFERLNGSYENFQTSPGRTYQCSFSHSLEQIESSESLSSSVRSIGSEEDGNTEVSFELGKSAADEQLLEWAKEQNSDILKIIDGYYSLPIPQRGEEIIFQPLQHLYQIRYRRSEISDLQLKLAEVNARLADSEEALALSLWTTATVCRALSLDNVLGLFAGALLEKQVVIVCSNLGILSAIVLSVIPMIRPFEWQSLLLPVLPRNMMEFLDAPVPFIAGVQNKPVNSKMKASTAVHVIVDKDQVKMPSLPQIPRCRELLRELRPIHARLSCQKSVATRHPVYKCNEVQAEAAGQFLSVMRGYLESLCSDLRFHTITNVQSNNDKVSLLLKDSFIDSFPSREQPFIKLLVETQLFSVLSDSRLSRFEND